MGERKNAGQPELSEQEQKEVEWRSAPRTEVVYEAIREEGEGELRRSSPTLAWDGLAAGLPRGFCARTCPTRSGARSWRSSATASASSSSCSGASNSSRRTR